MLCRKSYCSDVEKLDERVAFFAVTESSHVISPMCQFRNSLYLPLLLAQRSDGPQIFYGALTFRDWRLIANRVRLSFRWTMLIGRAPEVRTKRCQGPCYRIISQN